MPADSPPGRKASYQEFRIEVLDLTRVRVTRPGRVTMQGDIRCDELTRDTLDVFTRQLAQGRIMYRQELEVIGSYLYHVLFEPKVAQAFEDDFAEVRKKRDLGEIMRLKLEFQRGTDQLARLPWEYLYAAEWDGSKGRFIATEPQLMLTRFVPLARNEADYSDHADDRQLRILAAVSAPERQPRPGSYGPERQTDPMTIVDAEKIIKQLTDLRDAHPERFALQTTRRPTQRSLAADINEFKPHVLHFIGHGKYEGSEGFLAMMEESDDPKDKVASWTDDLTFADCFRDWTPRLVFLQACKGASSDSYSVFSGMALKLVADSVGAVVAMQYEVENEVATAFAERFYQSLSQGEPIDRAVQAGRLYLGRYINEGKIFSSRAFGSPVVFLQTADGIVLATDELASPAAQPYAPAPCPWGCGWILRSTEILCFGCHRRVARCPRCNKWNPVAPPSAPDGPWSEPAALAQGAAVAPAFSGFLCMFCGYRDAPPAAGSGPSEESMEPSMPAAFAGTLSTFQGPAGVTPVPGRTRLP